MNSTGELLPTVLIPGLFCTPRIYVEQLPLLWRFGPVTVADHRRDDSMTAIAQRILTLAPEHFALVGLSMGGYIAFEIMRLAPQRVKKLALLDTAARPDTAEQTKVRREQIELAQRGQLGKIAAAALPMLIHRADDPGLRATILEMAAETGPDAFVRQQYANIGRIDSRPHLRDIRCPTLVMVGAEDRLIPRDRSEEIAAGIANSRLVVIPECGHIATLEQPERCNAELLAWMREEAAA